MPIEVKKYDIIVIGGGAGGLTCAIGAIKLNKKVLLIERRKIGGECTWSGCVPSKAFIQYSKDNLTNKDNIFQKVRDISDKIYTHETPELLESYGIDVVLGEAQFQDPHHIKVDDQLFTGKKIVITTGTSPFIPDIKGLNESNMLSNDNFFKQNSLPKSIVFVGAGVITMELAIPLARLGVKVSILEKATDVLAIAEEFIRTSIKETLKKYNIDLITDVTIEEIISNNIDSTVHFLVNNQKQSISTEKIFIASGRVPNIEELHLEKIGIAHTKSGIIVDDYLRTSQAHIYALGDCVGPFRFSHVAGKQGELFIRNLILPFLPAKYPKTDVIPYVVFTDPEYAKVGLLEKEAREQFGDNIKIYESFQADSERAVISLEEQFYIKIITHKGLIVVATVLCSKAGEIANLLQWLYASKTPFRKFTTVTQAYPSYGDFLRKIAKKAMIDDLLSNPIVKLFRK